MRNHSYRRNWELSYLGILISVLGVLALWACGNKEDGDANQVTPELAAKLEPPTDYLCECAMVPGMRLDEDDEDKGLEPIEDREVRAAQRIARNNANAGRLDSIEGKKVFFGNLHSHSGYSDGSSSPQKAFEHARDKGKLDFLALTEHNHKRANHSETFGIAHNNDRYEGPRTDGLIPVANSLTKDDQFIALYGQEFSSISKGNHLNVFDVPKVIQSGDVPNGRFDKLLNDWLPKSEHLDSEGEQGILQMNHPWNGNSSNTIEYGRDDFGSFTEWRDKLDPRAQLIEVINGPSHEGGENKPPRTVNAGEFRRYLNLGFHLGPVANQDNHKKTWGTITHARTGVVANRLTKTDVLEALRNRNVYASLDRNLKLVALVEGELCGTRITNPVVDGQELSIEISIEDGDEAEETYWVEVFADKKIDGESDDERAKEIATFGPLKTSPAPAESNIWSLAGLEYDGWDYLYFRVQEGDLSGPTKKQAWLAPVWFEG